MSRILDAAHLVDLLPVQLNLQGLTEALLILDAHADSNCCLRKPRPTSSCPAVCGPGSPESCLVGALELGSMQTQNFMLEFMHILFLCFQDFLST